MTSSFTIQEMTLRVPPDLATSVICRRRRRSPETVRWLRSRPPVLWAPPMHWSRFRVYQRSFHAGSTLDRRPPRPSIPSGSRPLA